ncbi:MAG: acyltransferase [Geobacteraceae bacterium GWC2_58_44]|nr:MAG: acyltransferase [Geobacteraceae bacterium GWC2_58_44]HBG05072.1 acyltransferase [Geobacter sp.]
MALYSNMNLFFIKLLTILVPRFLHPPFAFFWGGLFYLVLPGVRRNLRKNLRAVTGSEQVERLVLGAFYKFSRNWCDIMLMTRLPGPRLLGLIGRWTTEKPLDDALAAGHGAILISIHLGNWELGGLGLAEKGYRMNVLTYREPDEKVNLQRETVRRERGINFIYVDREATSPFAIIEAVSALNRNEVLAILGDRDGSSHTRTLDFFGRPTPIPLGAAYLALASGAPVIPVFVPLEGERYAAIMEEPIFFRDRRGEREQVIVEGTGRILRVFERYIRSYPDQWYNFFDYWPSPKYKEKPD